MLKLQNITKNYYVAETTVTALKGVSINFRRNEFVSILGASGCGKTTLLNIVGGLDRYTSGDLIIEGRSTKDFKSKDWDSYRNHSVGFIFQSYNLIPHQTVLSNVELALTLSGVSKHERRNKAKLALEKVGLGDQLTKKPNQMSGGQMQRVAIARAIVNDPEIILADEPTGALDTQTSVQVMDILKEIAKDRLVIMVTHNPELAANYSTRIVKLLDGEIIDDSNPYDGEVYTKSEEDIQKDKDKTKHTSMSFLTALSLSFNNLFTKKARTILTAFAGSIGIIGIALILSLSSGFNSYIKKIEEETLSTYPITIESETMDLATMMSLMMGNADDTEYDDGLIHRNDVLGDMLKTVAEGLKENDLKSFKTYIENNSSSIESDISAIKYTYNSDFSVYSCTEEAGNVTSYSTLIPFGLPTLKAQYEHMGDGDAGMMIDAMLSGTQIWEEMLDNQQLLDSQYEVVNGSWPTEANEVVVVVGKDNTISDYALYSLGLISELDMLSKNDSKPTYTPNEIVGLNFKLATESDFYSYNTETSLYKDLSGDDTFMKNNVVKNGLNVEVSGVIRQKEDSKVGSISGVVGYTSKLTEWIVNHNQASDVVIAQKANTTSNVVTGQVFDENFTYDSACLSVGAASLDKPSTISIYPSSFEGKERIVDFINDYNNSVGEDQKIHYTDYVAMMMSSITTIVNAITYVLIAFVAISLVVSSIMIGIITYISVLERTKEIGVIRSIGGSKKDIFVVFCAEALIIGFVSGILGILVTVVLDIPINIIINALAGIGSVAKLPILAAVILVVISMFLTFIAGLIPSSVASKKDPVIALRSE